MNIVTDDIVRVLEEPIRLVDEERSLVQLQPGCHWVSLMQEGERIGIAFVGPSSFAVDAIAETRMGAIGQSISGQLQGVQLYFGDANIESVSRVASDEEMNQSGLNGKSFEELVNNGLFTFKKWDMKLSLNSVVFLGIDESNAKILLLLSDDKIVFTHGNHIFIMKGQKMLTLNDQGVVLTGYRGVPFYIGKHGIQRIFE